MAQPAGQVPTIADVARLAEVSTMTVSRALNGHSGVRPATRESVLRAAELLGYRRNENARSLRPGHQSGLIGLGITNIANPYYAEFTLGVEEVANSFGRRVILATTRGDNARERQIVSDLLGRQIEGLILVPVGTDTRHLQPTNLRGVPLVLASRTANGVATDNVLVDDVGGAVSGTTLLLDRGHTRIGYLGTSDDSFTGRRRLNGFVRAHAEWGMVPPPDMIKTGCHTVEDAARAARELLHSHHPTAFFCSNNRNTVGLLTALASESRFNTPGQTPEVVGFDQFELSDLIPTPLTIINHDPKALGAQSAELLFERLTNPGTDRPPQHVDMPTWLLPNPVASGWNR